MSVQSLQIGEKRVLVARESNDGLGFTLAVKAMRNWPKQTGQYAPSIPLDIILHIKQSYGSVFAEYSVALPNVGFLQYFSADKIEVSVEYSAQQGLAKPYSQYLITGDLINGEALRPTNPYTNRFTPQSAEADWPSVAGPSVVTPIPEFATEMRVTTDIAGRLHLSERYGVNIFDMALPTGPRWSAYYDLDAYSRWTQLPPLAYTWQTFLYYYNRDGSEYYPSVSVEFR